MVGPGLSGGEPGKPVSVMAPPVAWAIMSKLLYSLYGSVAAEALHRQVDRCRGLIFDSVS